MYTEILHQFRRIIPDEEILTAGINHYIPTNLANILLYDVESRNDILLSLNMSEYGLGKHTEPLLAYLAKINNQILPSAERFRKFVDRLKD
jgi:hypothetical protein